MNAKYAVTFMMKQPEIRITASLPAPNGRTFPRTGYAPYAPSAKTSLKRPNSSIKK